MTAASNAGRKTGGSEVQAKTSKEGAIAILIARIK